MAKKLVHADPPGKKVMIIGATSGIGKELYHIYTSQGCIAGITGRRAEILNEMKAGEPELTHFRVMDVQKADSTVAFDELVDDMGGLDLMIFSAGVGTQNPDLKLEIEMEGVYTNVVGFSNLAIHAYNFFKQQGYGHIAVISSLAGIKSLRQSPAYSATKRFQIHYTSCLAQKAHQENIPLWFTTIVPGFIRTGMLRYKYPFTTSLEKGSAIIFNRIENKRRYSTVPGRWRWIEFIWRLIPNVVWEKIW